MEIRLKPDEFSELRRFLGATKNAKLITNFNKIFDQSSSTKTCPVKGTWTPVTKETIIEISPENGQRILQVIANHGDEFGDLLRNGVSVSSIGRWMGFFKNLSSVIKKSLK